MTRLIITNAIVTKGYNEQPAVFFSEKSDFARFRVGFTVYDPRAEHKNRWVFLTVKAFGNNFCERIRKMSLTEGTRLNLIGRYDEDVWEDQKTHEKRSMPVMVLMDTEFCMGNKNNNEDQASSGGYQTPGVAAAGPQYGIPNGAASAPGNPYAAPAEAPQYSAPAQTAPPAAPAGNFSGYEPWGGGNNFF